MNYLYLKPEDLPEPHELYGDGQTNCRHCGDKLYIKSDCAVLTDHLGEVHDVVTHTCENCEAIID